jgi:hypothetical protein
MKECCASGVSLTCRSREERPGLTAPIPDYAAVAPHAPQFGVFLGIYKGFCHKKGKFI